MPVMVKDALVGKHGEYEMKLTNPPFGKKSAALITNEEGEQERQSLVVHPEDFRPPLCKSAALFLLNCAVARPLWAETPADAIVCSFLQPQPH
ncbi:MAG TPA: hypothetical protein VGI60_07985 [Chthoniobacterales bacterium]|jgi:hypothetical protein